MKLLITCKEATRLIVRDNHDLTLPEKISKQLHVFICKLCSAFEKQNALLNKAVHRFSESSSDTLSTKEKETMITELEKHKTV